MANKRVYQVLLNDLILVNHNDRFVGSIDKWKAHSNDYVTHEKSLPHRAFSIFLFNNKNQLLLQRRSSEKRTFPLCWTNTCCSHPNMIQLADGRIDQQPIRQSLHRALKRQLELDLRQETFFFANKILYKQKGAEDQEFGEFELDYVYLCKINEFQLPYKIVASEIKEVSWVGRKELNDFVSKKESQGGYFSPWFSKMRKSGQLQNWWNLVESNDLHDHLGENEEKALNLL